MMHSDLRLLRAALITMADQMQNHRRLPSEASQLLSEGEPRLSRKDAMALLARIGACTCAQQNFGDGCALRDIL